MYVVRLLLVGAVAGGVFWFVGLAHVGASTYIRPQRVVPSRTPQNFRLVYQDVNLVTSDGLRLGAWYMPGTGSSVLILVHGIGANRGDLLPLARDLHRRGYGVLLFDLRAHGTSEGSVSTLGVNEVRDVRAALEFVQSQPGVDPSGVGIYGLSLGAGVAVLAAAELPDLGAVVSDSGFASARWIVDHQLGSVLNVPTWLGPLVLFFGELQSGISADAAAPVRVADRIAPRPLLVIHGERDQTFLVENARLVHDAAHEPKELWLVPNTAHAGAYGADPAAYVARLDGFFAAALE